MTEYMLIADLPFGPHYLSIIKALLKDMENDVSDQNDIRRRRITDEVIVRYDKFNGSFDISIDKHLVIIDTDYLDIGVFKIKKSYFRIDIGLTRNSMDIFRKAVNSIHHYNKTLIEC